MIISSNCTFPVSPLSPHGFKDGSHACHHSQAQTYNTSIFVCVPLTFTDIKSFILSKVNVMIYENVSNTCSNNMNETTRKSHQVVVVLLWKAFLRNLKRSNLAKLKNNTANVVSVSPSNANCPPQSKSVKTRCFANSGLVKCVSFQCAQL